MESQVTMILDGYIVEFPGMTRTLTWPAEPHLDTAFSGVVGDAVAAFAPLLRPQSIDVLLYAYERETGEIHELAQPHWFATTPTAGVDLYVEPSTERTVCRSFDAITPATVKALIDEALTAEEVGPDIAVTWKEIRIYAVEVRLPNVFADREVLSLGVPRGDIGVKVERHPDGPWVRGPKSPADDLPLRLSMTGGESVPHLDITTYWSLWAPGGPGEPDLNAVIDALVARGWYLVGRSQTT